ncbi:hypothetical protein ES689_09325 [Frigoribacterium sp. ACAM 257]|uniref:hypothetical protein n=1 Tax=Frigoribacterium sp. ACAM 257 TaxID=2508998 RepID=UPI0011B9B8AB|nr:hypothetical protein [Frigoribacterium sp. ACAM 257]TWX38796.1 hypothetical protein ES689_09325 [Frigoribacterium sp. ACAM 257]
MSDDALPQADQHASPEARQQTASGPGRETSPSPSPSPGGRRPWSRRRTLLLGGAAVLFALGVVAAVVVGRTAATHQPQAAVVAYLDAVQQGEVERAMSLDGTEAGDDDVLLTDDAYAGVTDGVTGWRVTGSRVDGDSAAVFAVVQQGGEAGTVYDQQFTLEKDGTDLLLFDRWVLAPVELGTLTVQVGAPDAAVVTAAGVEVPHAGAEGDTVELRAFPGSYPATLDGAGAYAADDVVGIATGASSTGSPATLVATLTDTGEAAARTAVDGWLSACLASTDLAPDGCSFQIINEPTGYTLSDQKWTLEAAPAYEIGDWTSAGWQVDATTEGSATFTSTLSDGAGGTGTFNSVGAVRVPIQGVIPDVTAEGASFTSTLLQY